MVKQGLGNLEIAILLSALLHILVLYGVRMNAMHITAAAHRPDYIQLSTIPPEAMKQAAAVPEMEKKTQAAAGKNAPVPVIKNQIVDVPKPVVQQEPKGAAYLSNWNQSVKEEMVSRHKGGGYGTDNEKALQVSAQPKVPAGAPGQSPGRAGTSGRGLDSRLRGNDNIQTSQQAAQNNRPSQEALAQAGLTAPPQLPAQADATRDAARQGAGQSGNNQAGKGQSGKDQELALNSLLPSYSRMKSVPGIGDNNYLPGLKEGDVTLLNTKSFMYAGFVRRVAYRIFDQFMSNVQQSGMSQQDMEGIGSYAYVEADMSPAGKLLSVRLLRTSGSPAWDSLAVAACRSATWDANPPAGAQGKDGIIHFVFAPGRDVLVVGLLD